MNAGITRSRFISRRKLAKSRLRGTFCAVVFESAGRLQDDDGLEGDATVPFEGGLYGVYLTVGRVALTWPPLSPRAFAVGRRFLFEP